MDFYIVLGLEPQATTADVKRAFKRLSRRYHPGINPGDRAAEAMFQRISEAYETLVDPLRRQQYDAAGGRAPAAEAARAFEFAGFDFSFAARGAQAATFSELFADVLHPSSAGQPDKPEDGADLHSELQVSFLDAFRGVQRQVIVTRQDRCAACRGTGHARTPEARCAHCSGSGTMRWARGHMVFSKTCTGCAGTGRQRFHRCPICAAQGRVARTDAVNVDVPPGIADGVQLRIAERGHAGRFAGRNGDLYVTIHVEPHPLFRRNGDDLHVQVPVALHEAVLGARIDVPSPDGQFKLHVPAGTQAGQQFRLRGRGMPTAGGGRGDLVVEARLVLPAEVDERSKELIREFGRLNGGDVRRDLAL